MYASYPDGALMTPTTLYRPTAQPDWLPSQAKDEGRPWTWCPTKIHSCINSPNLVAVEHWNQSQWINETKASWRGKAFSKTVTVLSMAVSCDVMLCKYLHKSDSNCHCTGDRWCVFLYLELILDTHNRRYRNLNMCRFFTGVMFPSRTLSSTTLNLNNLSKSDLGILVLV